LKQEKRLTFISAISLFVLMLAVIMSCLFFFHTEPHMPLFFCVIILSLAGLYIQAPISTPIKASTIIGCTPFFNPLTIPFSRLSHESAAFDRIIFLHDYQHACRLKSDNCQYNRRRAVRG
jgi:hypothetical protein